MKQENTPQPAEQTPQVPSHVRKTPPKGTPAYREYQKLAKQRSRSRKRAAQPEPEPTEREILQILRGRFEAPYDLDFRVVQDVLKIFKQNQILIAVKRGHWEELETNKNDIHDNMIIEIDPDTLKHEDLVGFDGQKRIVSFCPADSTQIFVLDEPIHLF